MKNLIKKTLLSLLLPAFVASFVFSASASALEDDIILKVMEEEIKRSSKDLKLDIFGPPYFLSYQVKDNVSIELGADFGAIYKEGSFNSRNLYIELRVGDKKVDNSEVGKRYQYRHIRLPIEDDEDSLRRSLWLGTDSVYKEAVSTYLRKKGQDIGKIDLDQLSDFSDGEKNEHIGDTSQRLDVDIDKWRKIIKNSSEYFKEFKDVLKSRVDFVAKKKIRYYVNSEGTRIRDEKILINIIIMAWSQAEDGMWLSETDAFYATDIDELPTEETIKAKVRELSENLANLNKSEIITPYIGPAIFEPDAAGVLFHEAIGHRLEGERQRNEKEGKTFKDKVGKKIMAEFISLIDDPTIEKYEDTPLYGNYKFDDEGQKAEKVTLIENGILRNFLLSRTPIKGFSKTNGHGRSDDFRDPIGRMANLIVKSSKEYSREELKKILIEEAKKQKKEYGLLIKKVIAGETNTSRYNFQAFKGTPLLIYKVYVDDGREELVRGADFLGTPLSTINKVIAAGNDYTVFNGYCGAESGFIPVSTVSPSILLSEVELQRKAFKNAKLPILPAPSINQYKK